MKVAGHAPVRLSRGCNGYDIVTAQQPPTTAAAATASIAVAIAVTLAVACIATMLADDRAADALRQVELSVGPALKGTAWVRLGQVRYSSSRVAR